MRKQKRLEILGLAQAVERAAEKGQKVGESTLRHAAINGELDAIKVGQRAWAVSIDALEAYLSNRPKRGRKPRNINATA